MTHDHENIWTYIHRLRCEARTEATERRKHSNDTFLTLVVNRSLKPANAFLDPLRRIVSRDTFSEPPKPSFNPYNYSERF